MAPIDPGDPSQPQPAPSGDPAATSSSSSSSQTPSAEEKRGRRSRPKVKTGCSNCKQRRIKCDEARPACSQCVRSGRDCTGYPPPSRHAVPFPALRIAPKPAEIAIAVSGPVQTSQAVLPPRRRARQKQQLRDRQKQHQHQHQHGLQTTPLMAAASAAASLTSYRPSVATPLDQDEAAYFSLFRAQTASELSGYFDAVFWTQTVPQACHTEPAIRHAAVALGALYKTLEQSTRSPSPPQSPPTDDNVKVARVMSHWNVAVRQYSDACNAMVLLAVQNGSSNRSRLIASVLLGCFDAFIGDHKQAIVQIQTGIGLLNRLRTNPDDRNSASFATTIEPIEEELVTIFTRLAIQAKSYDLAFHFPEPFVIRLNPKDQPGRTDAPPPPPPVRPPPSLDLPFANLLEARHAYDHLLEGSLRLLEGLHLVTRQHYPLYPSSWQHHSQGFSSTLTAWSRAFQPLLDSRLDYTNNLTPRERSGIATLKMSQINAGIIVRSFFDDTESQFDNYTPHFRHVVELGNEVVPLHRHQDSRVRDKPSFSADLGIVAPLFVVATKCRHPVLRRHAIHILRSSARREGMWDSEMSACIAEWIIELEEGGKGVHLPPGPIPEENRVMIQSVDFDLRARCADVKVGPRRVVGHMPWMHTRQRTTRIFW